IWKTERLKKGLMQQLLTRGIGHKEYKDTPIGKTPKTWQTVKLGEVLVDVKYGTSVKANTNGQGLPVLGIPNILGGKIDDTNLRYVDLPESERRSLTLEDGDILLVRTNANPDYIGRCALFGNMNGAWLYASYLIRIRPDRKKALPVYLVKFLQSEKARKQFLSIARTSAGNYNINSQGVRRVTISLPSLPEQQKIAEIISVVNKKLEFEMKEKVKLERIKRGLMDLLLTGKVRVKVD
ncbi:MAG: restriction endonuclease subunit S, partial [Candidatus Bathyarchaeota archaeon]|nr:restriction endonuclease subunit S [Candidatus Bathyarchaeota archaeon]